jgi:uncharacterized membrane protein
LQGINGLESDIPQIGQPLAAESALRAPVIDILRGCAIVLMIFQHTPLYLLSNASESFLYTIASCASRIAFPLFLFLAGFSVYLSARKRIPKVGKTRYLMHLVYRVVGLFVLGVVVNLFRMGSYSTVNVLHIIGMAVLICGLVIVIDSASICKLLIAVMLLYSFIGPLQPPEALNSVADYFLSVFTKGEYSPGMWFIYSFIGLYACWFHRDLLNSWKSILLAAVFLILSIPLFMVGMSNVEADNRTPFLVLMLSCILISYHLILRLSAAGINTAFRVLAAYGRHALFIYVAHQFIFITVPALSDFRNKFDIAQTIAVFCIFLLIAYVLIRFFEKKRDELYIYQ